MADPYAEFRDAGGSGQDPYAEFKDHAPAPFTGVLKGFLGVPSENSINPDSSNNMVGMDHLMGKLAEDKINPSWLNEKHRLADVAERQGYINSAMYPVGIAGAMAVPESLVLAPMLAAGGTSMLHSGATQLNTGQPMTAKQVMAPAARDAAIAGLGGGVLKGASYALPWMAQNAVPLAKAAVREFPMTRWIPKTLDTLKEIKLSNAAANASGIENGLEAGAGDVVAQNAQKLRQLRRPPMGPVSSTGVQPPPVNYGPAPAQGTSVTPEAPPKVQGSPAAPLTPPPNATQLKIEALVAEARKQYPQVPEAQLRQGAAQMVMDEMNRDSAKVGGMGSGLEEAKPGSFAAPTGAATGGPGAEALVEPRGGSRGAWKTGLPVEDPSSGSMVQPLKQPPGAGDFAPGETVKLQDFKSRVGTINLDDVNSGGISKAEGQSMLEDMRKTLGTGKPGPDLIQSPGGDTHLVWRNGEGLITDFATVNRSGILAYRIRGGAFDPRLAGEGMNRINQKLWEMNPKLMPESMSLGAMKSWQKFRPTSEPE